MTAPALSKPPIPFAVSDPLARGLGWFSLVLGAAELAVPGRIARALGLEGKQGLVRAYGAREIAAGVPILTRDRRGLIARVAGDGLDLATLAPALRRDNPKRKAALIATVAVATITLLDVAATAGLFAGRRSA